MITNTEYFQERKRQRSLAFTLVELMVALSIFIILTAILTTSFILFLKSTVIMRNYADMTVQSQQFLENIGYEMRIAEGVRTASNNQLSIDIPTASGLETVEYTYNPNDQRVTREQDTVLRPVLSNVMEFNFRYFNFDGELTTSQPEIKEVQIEASMVKKVLFLENTNHLISSRNMMRNL